jgi:hypothetical protein
MQGGEHCSGREHGDGGAGQIEEFILVERKGNWWEGGKAVVACEEEILDHEQ